MLKRSILCKNILSSRHVSLRKIQRTVAAPRGGLGGTGGGGVTVGFSNVSRSNKYTCRVTKNCAFKLLYDLENLLHYYPENPGNCISAIPDFKIFPGEHAPGPP